MQFRLISENQPKGDQPQAIKQLVSELNKHTKDQVLLGITGSGKSLLPNERILVGVKTEAVIIPQLIEIGKLIDEILEENDVFVTDDDNEIVWENQLNKNYYAFAIDKDSKQSNWKKIKSFIRHPSPEKLYKIKTTCGREITVTADHNLYIVREGCLKLLETKDINKGDFLPIPLKLPSADLDLEFVSTYQALKDEKVYVEIPFDLVDELNSISREKKWRVKYQQENVLVSAVPSSLMKGLNFKGKKYSLPANLGLNDDWIFLIGAYIAEGHSTDRYFLISAQEEEWHQRVLNSLHNLRLPYTIRQNKDIQVSQIVLTKTLSNWCNKTSFKKRFPPFWFSLSNKQLSKLLSAYFAGDGGVEAAGVYCATVSKELADDLLWALMRFGIWARIRYRNIKKPNGSPTFYWTISITGQENLEKFADSIGFAYQRKQNQLEEKLATLKTKKANTNVDVIPIHPGFIKTLREKFNQTQYEFADSLNLSQALISMFENGHRKPSRKVWHKIISHIEFSNEIDSATIDYFESFLNCNWTQIKEVEEITSESEFVYDVSVEDWETFTAGFGGLFVHNTFTIANVIQEVQRPTLVLAHNKTLAAQLYQEFKTFFPENAVEYFVSYYDYYQPEAYVPASDLYIEKEATINEEIDRLRLSATRALFERRDVIVVASVSCIYGLGDPDAYFGMLLFVESGQLMKREDLIRKLVELQYERSDIEFTRGNFRVRGDVVEIYPSYQDLAYRIEFWGDEIDGVYTIDPLLGEVKKKHDSRLPIYPKTHYVMSKPTIKRAIKTIKEELDWWEEELIKQGKIVESQRLHQRTMYDLEMIKEMGFCRGIENYSRHLTGKNPGDPPPTLLHYLPSDSIIVIDESHQTIPQLGAMFKGDQSRKGTLVEYGFRLPSAKDNRPLNFDEFNQMIGQTIYVSATPGNYELEKTEGEVVEQVIRPTGLLDPIVEVRPVKGQIDDLLHECRIRAERNERVLVTTLTKKMSESLSEYFAEVGVKVQYLHSDIDTLERIKILRNLRRGEFDVLVGINLLREGLDLPEVSLVAILDADKEGFLRSERSLIQTIGRAARNSEGKAILYADKITDSMRKAIDETNRRRKIQEDYNSEHGITPKTIVKAIEATLVTAYEADYFKIPLELDAYEEYSPAKLKETMAQLEHEMRHAAKEMKFEQAAEIRDRLKYLQERSLIS